MPRSYNGYLVGTAQELGIKTFPVPGSHVRLTILPAVAVALLWVAEQVDQRVADIDVCKGHRTPDDWGQAYRRTRGATSWSNHASGTAIDLNATQWPRGMRRMTLHQVTTCREIVAEINHAAHQTIIQWGGDYHRAPVDQMHFEIASGVSPGDVHRAMQVLNAAPKPKPKPKPHTEPKPRPVPKPVHPPTLRMHGRKDKKWTAVAQHRLGITPDGIFGQTTRAHVIAFRRKHHLRPFHPGVIGPKTWVLLLKEN